ncbi:micrococcal nuclease [Mycoplasma testudineum]|uniref:Micrococcal nuclease n=2 Tax=Mycoplasma testudineum TaxID=244584 RepID=A0A4R6IHF3_9MOLU|nr:thermonuclease family protein [Mycoplasma testudineum]OYD26968.1 hypothetical protein CG473_01370 [Mycoplasma testudineum]TDO20515.1 micrococcal nuclease [Mycoplasma testudineum]
MKIISVFSLSIIFTLVSCQNNTKQTYHTTITSVYDGDTFYDDFNTYRLFGVDTPELKTDSILNSGLQGKYALEATNLSKKVLINQKISITKISVDPYKRIVAKVITQNDDLAKILLSKGLAIVKYFNLEKGSLYHYDDEPYFNELLKVQSQAIKTKSGFWKLGIEKMALIFPKHQNIFK